MRSLAASRGPEQQIHKAPAEDTARLRARVGPMVSMKAVAPKGQCKAQKCNQKMHKMGKMKQDKLWAELPGGGVDFTLSRRQWYRIMTGLWIGVWAMFLLPFAIDLTLCSVELPRQTAGVLRRAAGGVGDAELLPAAHDRGLHEEGAARGGRASIVRRSAGRRMHNCARSRARRVKCIRKRENATTQSTCF